MANDEWSIEWLTNFAAEIKQARLEAFKASIELAHRAKTMGPGAVKAVSPYLGWTAQAINRLAGLYHTLKERPELIDPEVPLGIYWHLLKTDTDDMWAWMERAIRDGLSLGQLKELRGEKRERETQEPPFEGEVWAQLSANDALYVEASLTAPEPRGSIGDWLRVHVRAVELDASASERSEVEDDRQE